MLRTGARNGLADIAGIKVGHAVDTVAWTGVTVIAPDQPIRAALDLRGGGPATRETALLAPETLVKRIDALVFAGGSAFGLAATDGVIETLAQRGRGFPAGPFNIPIVPAACLFDLTNGGARSTLPGADYRQLGLAALAALDTAPRCGNVGAGYGAKAGRLKGGLGEASCRDPLSGITVAALAAVNPFGSVLHDPCPTPLAWAYARQADGLEALLPPDRPLAPDPAAADGFRAAAANTTLVALVTDAALNAGDLQRLAIMAQDGLSVAIRPCHTPFDGDAVFALSSARHALPDGALGLARLGTRAVAVVARAIMRAVVHAAPLGTWPAYRDLTR